MASPRYRSVMSLDRQSRSWSPAPPSASAAASRCGWRRRARASPSTTTARRPKRARTAAECGGAELFRANLESVAEIERMFARSRSSASAASTAWSTTPPASPASIRSRSPRSDWDFIHSVNLKAVFFCCQHGARLMQKTGGGRIVNISSLGGIRPWAEHAHYCASKAGVIMLTRALAKAFAPEITVNSVAPGVIPFEDIDERGKAMIEATPAGRGGTPAEIADAVVYFLKASNFVTGQMLAVDGGLSQR